MANVPRLVHVDPATQIPITDNQYPDPDIPEANGTQVLTDAATVVWDLNAGLIAQVTLGGNRTLEIRNLRPCTMILDIYQDGTGSRTLGLPVTVKWPSGAAPTLTTTASARDTLFFFSNGENLVGSSLLNVS